MIKLGKHEKLPLEHHLLHSYQTKLKNRASKGKLKSFITVSRYLQKQIH